MPLGWETPLQLRDQCSAHRRSATSCATIASAQGTVSRGRAARRGGRWNSCCSCDAQQRLQQRVGIAHGGWSDEEEVKKVSQIGLRKNVRAAVNRRSVHQLQSGSTAWPSMTGTENSSSLEGSRLPCEEMSRLLESPGFDNMESREPQGAKTAKRRGDETQARRT